MPFLKEEFYALLSCFSFLVRDICFHTMKENMQNISFCVPQKKVIGFKAKLGSVNDERSLIFL